MSISQVINIADWAIKKYEGVKSFVKTKYRQHRARKIRNAVDKRNTRALRRVVRSIAERRKNKQDSV